MATAARKVAPAGQAKEIIYAWEGKDKAGKTVKGELRASGEATVNATLRRQGILVTKVKKKSFSSGKKITEKDITLFTRQLATMMKAGVPLLQSFEIDVTDALLQTGEAGSALSGGSPATCGTLKVAVGRVTVQGSCAWASAAAANTASVGTANRLRGMVPQGEYTMQPRARNYIRFLARLIVNDTPGAWDLNFFALQNCLRLQEEYLHACRVASSGLMFPRRAPDHLNRIKRLSTLD